MGTRPLVRFALVAALAALVPACTQNSSSAKKQQSADTASVAGGGRLALTMPTLPGVDPASSSFVVTIQPANVTQTAPYSSGSQFLVNNLPAGQQTVQVQVVGPGGAVLWQGSTAVAVTANAQATATVTLAPAAAVPGTGAVLVNILVSPATASTTTITWGDEAATATATGTTTPAATPTVVVDVLMTAEGTHVVGGTACPQGYTAIGSFADCGGGTCNGNQNVCVATAPLASLTPTSTMVQAIVMTAENSHLATDPTCPAGTVAIGAIADCGGGTCSGNQLLCKQVVAVNQVPAGTFVPGNLSLTPEGTHVVGGVACPAGSTTVASAADCGGGTCNGNQLLCELP